MSQLHFEPQRHRDLRKVGLPEGLRAILLRTISVKETENAAKLQIYSLKEVRDYM
jgi:hypothetical protein